MLDFGSYLDQRHVDFARTVSGVVPQHERSIIVQLLCVLAGNFPRNVYEGKKVALTDTLREQHLLVISNTEQNSCPPPRNVHAP